MWGITVVIPPKYRESVLEELHQEHIGVVKMKSIARSYVWWPGIDHEIEHLAKACTGCQQIQTSPGFAPLHHYEWPSAPSERIRIDFAGPFVGSMFMIVVEAYSKWPEICMMNSTTSGHTIDNYVLYSHAQEYHFS
jgi:hypothetical protein